MDFLIVLLSSDAKRIISFFLTPSKLSENYLIKSAQTHNLGSTFDKTSNNMTQCGKTLQGNGPNHRVS